jgi:hypothetical protein
MIQIKPFHVGEYAFATHCTSEPIPKNILSKHTIGICWYGKHKTEDRSFGEILAFDLRCKKFKFYEIRNGYASLRHTGNWEEVLSHLDYERVMNFFLLRLLVPANLQKE